MLKYKPIEWWVKQIKEDKYFSLARFGDGELLCIMGKKGHNSHGCNYTPELRADLIKAAVKVDRRYFKGLQRVLPKMAEQFKDLTSQPDWYDSEVFADALATGKLKPFFEALKNKHVIFISSEEKQAIYKYLKFKSADFYTVPFTNAHVKKNGIIRIILETNKPGVYLFACGMAAGTMVNELHGKIKDSFFIDIGHILDPFIGDLSRDYLLNIPNEILRQNLP